MRLLSRMRSLFATAPARDAADGRWWNEGSVLVSAAGVAVTMPAIRSLGACQAVRHGISSAISSLPFRVLRRDGEGDHAVDAEHPLDRLLNRAPNRRRTRQELMSQLVSDLLFERNALCRLLPGANGEPVGGLEWIAWSRVQKIEAGDVVSYLVAPPAGAVGTIERLTEDDVWHVRMAPLTVDGLRGQNVVESSSDVFGRALAVRSTAIASSGTTASAAASSKARRSRARKRRPSSWTGGVPRAPGRSSTPTGCC